VDRAALDAALHYNSTINFNNNGANDAKKPFVHITGWCPKGRLAEDGPISSRYPLIETLSSLYSERTEWNIRDADATLVLLLSATTPPDRGTALTIEKASELQKPSKIVFLDDNIMTNITQVLHWMNDNKVKMLNVAGPRESNSSGIYAKAYDFVTALLEMKNEPAG
ncbi:putative molybdenum carrier-domain-containing protein, partial [Glomus cerebriforme]